MGNMQVEVIFRTIFRVMIIATISFILHFIWEILQCTLFYVHGLLPPTITAMIGATFGDTVMTRATFVIVAFATSDFLWVYHRWTPLHWLMIETAALIQSIGIEKIGLQMKRWSYKPLAPILPFIEVGLFPVLQLIILIPVTFMIAALIDGQWTRYRQRNVSKSHVGAAKRGMKDAPL